MKSSEVSFLISQQVEQDDSAELRLNQLESQVSTLRTQISTLQSEVSFLEGKVSNLRGSYLDHGFMLSIISVICAIWAQNTGRSVWLWFFLGSFFGPITLVVLLIKNSQGRRL